MTLLLCDHADQPQINFIFCVDCGGGCFCSLLLLVPGNKPNNSRKRAKWDGFFLSCGSCFEQLTVYIDLGPTLQYL